MNTIGRKETLTQQQVIQFFKDQLDYRYLGHWQDRVGNSNIEEGLLRDWLKRQGHSDKIIGKVLYELGKAKPVIGVDVADGVPSRASAAGGGDFLLARACKGLLALLHWWLIDPAVGICQPKSPRRCLP